MPFKERVYLMLGMFGLGIFELLILGMVCAGPLVVAVIVVVVVLAKKQGGAADNALVPCPDCGRPISPLAESCPQCGRPT